MSQVFGHKYECYIGNAGRLLAIHNEETGFEKTIPPLLKAPNTEISLLTGGFVDYRTIPADTTLITNPIQMDAKIVYEMPKQSSTTSQLSRFKFYNLDEETINQIKQNSVVLLKAGYETDKFLPLAFTGTVQKVFTELEGSNLITEIFVKDSGNPINSVKFAKSYPSGTNTDFIFLDIIDTFGRNGVPLGRFEDSKRALQRTSEPLAFNGKVADILTEICEGLDYVWFTCKGRLYIQAKELDRPTEFLEVKPENIIGKLSSLEDTKGKEVTDSSTSPKGVKFTTFLNAEFGIDSYIKIATGQYAGNYKPTKVTFDLNWKHGPWVAIIEAEEVKVYEI